MSWHAQLQLDYLLEHGKTVARYEHTGPLRILQSLYPEGDSICHNVVVHPPSGLVGGDTLDVRITLGRGAQALLTTPGATRFYRSEGEPARQSVRATLADGARLEWLPLEALAYTGCIAHNQASFDLQPGAEMMGWDVTALGLPLASQPFAAGSFTQHMELPGVWLERARIDASDRLLMDGQLGLKGHRCMATLFFAAGADLARPRRDAALDAARDLLAGHAMCGSAGATAPNPRMVTVRVLAPVVEPAMQLMRQVWATWRAHLWQKTAASPRIWAL